jgi:nicotinamidase-related amidase
VPTIYVNDNFGQWRSDFRQTVAHCTARSSPGRVVSSRLRPTKKDYFVLKPKHSGFFDTTLDTLLEALKIRRLIIAGIAGNICVLFTANDAYMREFQIYAPPDCIVSNTVEDNVHALRQIEVVMKGRLPLSTELKFRKTAGTRNDRSTSV